MHRARRLRSTKCYTIRMKSKNKYKILYVEDLPIIQAMYVDELSNHGFTVTAVNDGKQALEQTAKQKFDIIILDLMLHNVNGPDFLREFIKTQSPSNIVVFTDLDKPEVMEEVKGLGVKHYWIKVENSPSQLAERLDRLLAEKSG